VAEFSNALFDRWPGLRPYFPTAAIGDWPTPVELIDAPGRFPGPPVWVKREDKSSALYGGNKVRKLAFLLGDGAGSVITVGALGSHHVLATAIHAGALGRPCVGLLVPQPMTEHSRAVYELLGRHCTACVRLDHPFGGARALVQALADIRNHLTGMTVIPPGASSPLGTLGYVACGLELAAQIERGDCPAPRRIYVALGTGGTAAGLALGLALGAQHCQVVAVRVAVRATGNQFFLGALARRSMALLRRAGLARSMPEINLVVDHRFIGPGYASVTDAALDAVARGAELGLDLETTYTGKAFAALLADRVSRPAEGPLMLLNTLGSIEHLRAENGDGLWTNA
jgi:D-cysteine desulfhydrase